MQQASEPPPSGVECLRYVMRYGDRHLDANGIKQYPSKNLVTHVARGGLGFLLSGGWLKLINDSVQPTPKSQAWWIRQGGIRA